MDSKKWLALLLLSVLTGCFGPVREPDCLLDGTCECKVKADCPSGSECVDGKCFEVPDAGLPGEMGWPCSKDSECLFGPCLPPGPGNGGVCSAVCAVDGGLGCNKGWDCKQAPSGLGFTCTPPLHSQCLACAKDSDCNTIGDRCTRVGTGNFCTTDCSLDGRCPAGNVCRVVPGGDGGTAIRQCIPQSNSCECSAISAGLTRACRKTNPRATCFGVETCAVNGSWGACDALTAAAETCDGVDNDCDGLTDQSDPDLITSGVPGYPNCRKGVSCTGKWSCRGSPDAGYAFSCSAPDPKGEVCNGADDDCDGQVDNGLLDMSGNYVSPRACGSCATDCFSVLKHLENDAGVVVDGAATCELRTGVRTCVPRKCEKGSFLSPTGDPQICEPFTSSQCHPCTTSADCRIPGDECVTFGTDPDPSCAQSCDTTSLSPGCTGRVGERGCCPMDSTCQLKGGKKLCVPNGDSCQCTPDRVGLTRSCFITSGAATCIGNQTCNAQGSYGMCDTSMTSLEFCDGRDNDCDGLTDDGFINTRGTGTYDTDAHCGSCNTNCKARWSETIQHAIGGCAVTQMPPACAIASCTTERVGGGGSCRLDSECGNGAFCHPTFRQCVRSCGDGGTCNPGDVCESGLCTRACSSSGECVMAFGTGAQCNNGRCGLSYQFVDADKDDTNGCECASTAGEVDAPERWSTYPTSGLPYVDRDCDGVDGQASKSLFVWAQSTSSLGTRTAPFKTIAEAIRAFNPASHTSILVAQGTYAEQVILTNGVQLYGGYSADFARRDIILFPTFIEAAEPTGSRFGTVNAEGLSGRTVISGFTIRGYDVNTRPIAGQQARSSYAVYVRDSSGLIIQNNHVVGGRGGDGTPARAGAAGNNGVAGQNGLDARECNDPDCSSLTQNGGQPGANTTCDGLTRGNAGAGSDLSVDPQQYGGGGLNGRGGNNAVYQHSDPSQSAFCKYDCTVPGQGLAGGAAQNGTDGLAANSGAGCSGARGSIVNGDWTTSSGNQGSDGAPGRGGGGGGAGGCVRNANPPSCTIGRRVGDLGGTGGGGGAGGCGGARGNGGGGGGGSFAIFVVGTPPAIDGNLIDFGYGGFGGSGGAGGYGGLGGQGGRGGVNTTVAWCAGQGGPGGRGGNGGAGSGGGGGCGGSVFGIGGSSIAAQSYQMRNTIPPAPMMAVGAGGVGGASPAGTNFKGGDGSSGVISGVESF